MMIKEDVTNLILDLMYPFDPISYAGYGSKYQNEVQKAEMDSFLEIEDRCIDNFVKMNEPYVLVDTLLDLLDQGPSNNININKREEWGYYIQVLLVKIGYLTSDLLINKLEKHMYSFKEKRTFIIEVLTSVCNKPSHDAVLRIVKNNDDLSNYEIELIKDFEDSMKVRILV